LPQLFKAILFRIRSTTATDGVFASADAIWPRLLALLSAELLLQATTVVVAADAFAAIAADADRAGADRAGAAAAVCATIAAAAAVAAYAAPALALAFWPLLNGRLVAGNTKCWVPVYTTCTAAKDPPI
jgi:hypothetical protein